MLKGSCCCGKIQFELTKQPSVMGTCFCSRCRKLGASTIIFTEKENISILEGKNYIETYLPENGYKYERNFCNNCGSSLGEILSQEKSIPIPANLIDDEMSIEPTFVEFIHEKPNWCKFSNP